LTVAPGDTTAPLAGFSYRANQNQYHGFDKCVKEVVVVAKIKARPKLQSDPAWFPEIASRTPTFWPPRNYRKPVWGQNVRG
jgi:hypothetical protein